MTKRKKQIELEEQILIEEHELGMHDAENVLGCELCEGEEEISPIDPRPEDYEEEDEEEMVLVINAIDVIADIRAGVSPGDLSERVGLTRAKMRRAVDKKFGKGTYASLRGSAKVSSSISPSKESPGSLRSIDKDVTRIPSAKTKDGWTARTVFVDYGGPRLKNLPSHVAHDPSISELVIISPEGEEYVRARNDESADLIVDEGAIALGLDPVRLRRFETSSMFHRVRKNEELIKRGEKGLARTRDSKKIRRKGGLAR